MVTAPLEMNLPRSLACERNKQPIAEMLSQHLSDDTCREQLQATLLEVGSGTGEHAVYFASLFHNILWQPSDVDAYLPHIAQRCMTENLSNLMLPVALDLALESWPRPKRADTTEHADDLYDFVFTANTLHIVSLTLVDRFFKGCDQYLRSKGKLFIYGPFNYGGKYTSESNREFDGWLKRRDCNSGIRDIETIERYANALSQKLVLQDDIAMPNNNRLLVFQKE